MNDFAQRLTLLARFERRVYSRGFLHGVMAALAIVGFFAVYVYVGGVP